VASAVISFDKGSSCASGDHYELVVKKGATPIATVPIALSTLRDAPTNAELKDALMVVLREMIEISNPTTKPDARTFLDAATITIDFPVF